ncbi:hypothetical protein BJ546DRAFT_524918 [Cryomyces antarcticus]
MAVDQVPCRDTDSFVLPQKAFYPTKIPVLHWQLHHFISSPSPGILYYASGADVYCLDTATKKRRLVTTLPFETRCTASGYGWICVAGGEEHGQIAIIKLGRDGATGTEVDAALPLGFWDHGAGEPSPGPTTAHVRLERIGDNIINSISIHRLQHAPGKTQDRTSRSGDDDDDEVVAVLANNDGTVRIYSLTHSVESHVLDLPFEMNHATISPSGDLLLAVGDGSQAYLFLREAKSRPASMKTSNAPPLFSIESDWSLTSIIQLYNPPNCPNGFFTTAWSSSGALCAVGSECGYIMVIDISLIMSMSSDRGEDAIVQIIGSSRPDNKASEGSVRTMMFAPNGLDLLIWGEDSGRICVGDLRTGLRVKQVVELNPIDESLQKLKVVDLEQVPEDNSPELRELDQEEDFIRRYRRALDQSDTTSAVELAAEHAEARRRQRERLDRGTLSEVRAAQGDDPYGLTHHEQQVLEALRTTRQREEARARGQGTSTRGINYTNLSHFNRNTAHSPHLPSAAEFITSNREGSPARQAYHAARGEHLSNRERALLNASTENRRDFAVAGSLRDFVRDRGLREPADPNRDRERTPWQPSAPRRRASVVLPANPSTGLSNSTTAAIVGAERSRIAASRAVPTQAATSSADHSDTDSTAASPNSTSPLDITAVLNIAATIPSSDPWRTIEDAMVGRGPLFESASRTPPISSDSAATTATTTTTNPTTQPEQINPAYDPDTDLTADAASEMRRLRHLARARERVRSMSMRDQAAAQTAAAAAITASPEVTISASVAEYIAANTPFRLARGNYRNSSGGGGGGSVWQFGTYVRRSTADGARTAGLAMSRDGRTLWAATEEGIFECAVRVRERGFWPAVRPR